MNEKKHVTDQLITVHRNGVTHPLVIRHATTHDASFYFNVDLTDGGIELSNEQFVESRTELDSHLSRLDAAYVHHCLERDLIKADNFRDA